MPGSSTPSGASGGHSSGYSSPPHPALVQPKGFRLPEHAAGTRATFCPSPPVFPPQGCPQSTHKSGTALTQVQLPAFGLAESQCVFPERKYLKKEKKKSYAVF